MKFEFIFAARITLFLSKDFCFCCRTEGVMCGSWRNGPVVPSHLHWWGSAHWTHYIFRNGSHSTRPGILLILTSGLMCVCVCCNEGKWCDGHSWEASSSGPVMCNRLLLKCGMFQILTLDPSGVASHDGWSKTLLFKLCFQHVWKEAKMKWPEVDAWPWPLWLSWKLWLSFVVTKMMDFSHL